MRLQEPCTESSYQAFQIPKHVHNNATFTMFSIFKRLCCVFLTGAPYGPQFYMRGPDPFRSDFRREVPNPRRERYVLGNTNDNQGQD